MAKEYRLEDDLLIKSTPKFGSKRYSRLMNALWAQDNGRMMSRCEVCKKSLFNPRSILIHQGGFCQSKNQLADSMIKQSKI